MHKTGNATNGKLALVGSDDYSTLSPISDEQMQSICQILGYEHPENLEKITFYPNKSEFQRRMLVLSYDMASLSTVLYRFCYAERESKDKLPSLKEGDFLGLCQVTQVIKEQAEEFEMLVNAQWMFEDTQREKRPGKPRSKGDGVAERTGSSSSISRKGDRAAQEEALQSGRI